jgi:hypothetical protein
MKSNRVRFIFLSLDLFFQATLWIQIMTIKPLSFHIICGHQQKFILVVGNDLNGDFHFYRQNSTILFSFLFLTRTEK